MAAPTQMTAHTLDGLKGWPSPHAVDFQAKLSANVDIDPFPAGRVVQLDLNGELETGVTGGNMAMFTFQNSDDYDVTNEGGITSAGGWVGTSPSGNIGCLVACGAYELETTEFDTNGTFTPGTTLIAVKNNNGDNLGGKLQTGTEYAAALCGVVSRAEYTNSHGVACIAFWPVYLPKIPA